MVSVKIILFTSKILKSGESPIMLRLTQNRKHKYFSIGENCHPNLWDKLKGYPHRKHPLQKELILKIDAKLHEAKRLLMSLEAEKPHFTFDDFETLYKANNKRISFIPFLGETIETLITEGRISYATSHKDLRRVLLDFNNQKDFVFAEITPAFLQKFINYCRIKRFKPNTTGIYLRTFRAVYNNGVRLGLAKKADNPFIEIQVSRFRNETVKRAITKEDIKKIASLDISKDTLLYHSRNYFLFSYYCWGINFIDVARLEWSNIKIEQDGTQILFYTRSKTKKNFNIQLLDKAIEILDYYRPYTMGNYVFPFLDSHAHTSPEKINNRLAKTKRQTNKDLKELAKMAGIETNLTTYVARHTFATTMKRQGVSTSMISELMGHDSETTTQAYLDSFENEELYKATLNLL